MEEHKKILIRNCLLKSQEVFNDAKFNFENDRYKVTLNRVYYSIFYSIMALGYKDNFVSSKHKQLMGWFNKKYIKNHLTTGKKQIMRLTAQAFYRGIK